MDLTQTQIQKLFTYNENTGDLIWNCRDVSMFNRERDCKSWNTKYSNKCAGTKSLLNGKWYIIIRIQGKQYLAHRLIWVYMTGVTPIEIDHEDSNGLNNKWSNLRNVNHQINCKNTRMKSSNTSGVTGVHWCKRDQRWVSKICITGKTIYLGYFKDKQKAICSRLKAETDYNFHINHGTKLQ